MPLLAIANSLDDSDVKSAKVNNAWTRVAQVIPVVCLACSSRLSVCSCSALPRARVRPLSRPVQSHRALAMPKAARGTKRPRPSAASEPLQPLKRSRSNQPTSRRVEGDAPAFWIEPPVLRASNTLAAASDHQLHQS